jgi:hypothetical protein
MPATAASIAAKHAPKRRASSKAVAPVEAVPNLDALEQFISDATAAQQSAISPDDMVREQMVTGLRVTEAKIAALDEQTSLAQRLFDALMQSFAAHRANLDKAAARYRNGLLDGAEHQGRSET